MMGIIGQICSFELAYSHRTKLIQAELIRLAFSVMFIDFIPIFHEDPIPILIMHIILVYNLIIYFPLLVNFCHLLITSVSSGQI